MLIKKIKKTKNYDEWIEYIEDVPLTTCDIILAIKIKRLGVDIKVDF